MNRMERSGHWKAALALVVGAALVAVCWRIVSPVIQVVAGGCAFAFLLEPLARRLEKCVSRPLAAGLSLAVALAALVVFFIVLFPPMIRQLLALLQTLPASLEAVQDVLKRAGEWLRARGIPLNALPAMDFSGITGNISGIARGTAEFAVNLADAISRLAMMAVLSVFFLSDRDRLMLRLELLIPKSFRRLAVRMGSAVKRDLRLYLRGQAMVSIAVGALSALGLWLVGAPSPMVLGVFVGILNLIPYFGPVIGAVPVLIATLGVNFQTALFSGIVLIIVQQLDGMLISPRILGNITGFSPATVLVAVFLGACVSGILGMLLALPVLMAIRTCVRVFVQRAENV